MSGRRLRLIILVATVVALAVSLACTSTSPTKGRWFGGDTLAIRLEELQKTSELRWQGGDQAQAHYLAVPTSPDNELVMLRLTIRNDRAGRAIFTLDAEAAELQGSGPGETYRPIDVDARKVLVPQAHSDETKFARLLPNCPEAIPCVRFLREPVELLRNFQLAGWLIFEAPKGAQFTTLVWRAGDTIYLRF